MKFNRLIAMLLLACMLLVSVLTLGVGCKEPDAPQEETNDATENEKTDKEEGNSNPFASMTYVAFGDSITYGANHKNNYKQMDKPYPTLVGKELGIGTVKNLAVSGATFTANELDLVCMTKRITEYTSAADIISVQLGTNDWLNALPLGTPGDYEIDTVYGCLYLIAEHLTTTYKDSFVFFMTPYKTSLDRNDEYTLEDVANAIKHVAQEYMIPVLDMYELGQFEVEMNDEGSDGLHPSQKFFEDYTAPQIVEFIKENFDIDVE